MVLSIALGPLILSEAECLVTTLFVIFRRPLHFVDPSSCCIDQAKLTLLRYRTHFTVQICPFLCNGFVMFSIDQSISPSESCFSRLSSPRPGIILHPSSHASSILWCKGSWIHDMTPFISDCKWWRLWVC